MSTPSDSTFAVPFPPVALDESINFSIGEDDGFDSSPMYSGSGTGPPTSGTYTSSIGDGDNYGGGDGGGGGTFENENNPNANASFYEKVLFCFAMNTYKPYFDVDTIDIYDRIVASVTKCAIDGGLKAVWEQNGSGPDLYGPFWISTTLVFFLAVSSNLSMYLFADSASDFEYDISHVGRAMMVVYSFAFTLPAIFFFVFNCLSLPSALVELICLYGYSLVPFLPASLLCAIPVNGIIWIVLLGAMMVSLTLVLKNLRNGMISLGDGELSSLGRKKEGPIIATIIGCHVIFLFVLKLSFYHHSASANASAETDPYNPE